MTTMVSSLLQTGHFGTLMEYDSDGEYIPGEGWNEKNNCYESEIEDYDEYDYQDDELGQNMLKDDDYENLDDDVFESDFQINDSNFAQLFEGIKLEDNKKNENEIKDDNNNIKVDKNEIEDEVKNNDFNINENANEEEENGEKPKDKNINEQQKGKIIITRENQEKYLDGKIIDDIQKNNENLQRKDNNDNINQIDTNNNINKITEQNNINININKNNNKNNLKKQNNNKKPR